MFLIDNDSQSCIILVENDYQYRIEHSPHIYFVLIGLVIFNYPLLYARKRLTLRNDVSIKAVDL